MSNRYNCKVINIATAGCPLLTAQLMDIKVIMKKDLHPDNYRLVVFQDTSSDFKILTRSTAASNETIKWEDGNEYPLVKVHVSSASHPFFTGEEKVLDIEGRVDKFKARAEAAAKAKEAKIAATKKAESKSAKKSTKEKETTKENSKESKADSEK